MRDSWSLTHALASSIPILVLTAVAYSISSEIALLKKLTTDIPEVDGGTYIDTTAPHAIANSTKPPLPVAMLADLFGQHKPAMFDEIAPEAVPKTELNLELRATFVHSNPALSAAIIKVEDNEAGIFLPGDQVSTSARLLSIRSNVVLLSVDDDIESLFYPSLQHLMQN